MNEPDAFDTLLAARFEREHRQVSADPFVASTMQRIRFEQRLTARIRTALGVSILLAAIVASPWLISGAARLNAALASSLNWAAGLPGAGLLAALAVLLVLARRLRSR